MKFKPGIVFGKNLEELYQHAKKTGFAIPAVNTTSTSSINAVLETARKLNSPAIIQVSTGGAEFFAGKSLSLPNQKAAALGAISAANHIHLMAEHYGVPVIIHTDHASKKHLPWIDQLLEAGEKHFAATKRPLFSSHMLDLSEEPLDENLEISKSYFQRMNKIQTGIEIELGVTGGEEDGVDNNNIDSDKLYTQPEHVDQAYVALKSVGDNFTIAASFGNVHGVYSSGNVKLSPIILKNSQEFVRKLHNLPAEPVSFVFHGGSGSSAEEIKEAISYGVVKMNIDTDLQWAYWDGVRVFYKENEAYLQSQLGNPKGADAPNKKFYDPRNWLRKAESSFVSRLEIAYEQLNCLKRNE